jgi:Mg-chelatase subunit ChlD
MAVNDKDIEIVRHAPDERAIVSNRGIEISYKGKAVSGNISGEAYVYLVVDCSGSMKGDKLDQAKKGALSFANDALTRGYHTGLIQFHKQATLLCEPQKETSILQKHIAKMSLGGKTHMAEAIHLAHEQLKMKKAARVVMVIVTDGIPNGPGDPQASLRAGDIAKRDGIDIIIIGTDDADQNFLQKLASRSELGMKVSRQNLEITITSSAKLLPAGRELRTQK